MEVKSLCSRICNCDPGERSAVKGLCSPVETPRGAAGTLSIGTRCSAISQFPLFRCRHPQ